ADTGNNRILSLDENLKVIGCYKSIVSSDKSTFASPLGIFASTDGSGVTSIYVADSDNGRGVKLLIQDETTAIAQVEYTKPDNEAYTAEAFTPSKVSVDKEGNVYLISTSVSTGALRYDQNGEFKGFYGANRVEKSAAVIARKVWRAFASEKKQQGMLSSVPTEFNNFDVDEDGFMYTVTEAANAATDAVKKLNPAGYNIWDNVVGNDYEFGDFAWGVEENTSKSTKLTDIVIGDNGTINLLDYETGRVFQYDMHANLLFIFGAKSIPSEQEGSFTSPNAIESYGKNIYVLDGTKNDITVFTETIFGKYVHEASEYYVKGQYYESKHLWEEVIRRDGGYTLAHIALGKAALNNGDYKEAMEYFKTAYDQINYDKAFKYYRDNFLREHFNVIVIVLFLLIVLILVINRLRKKGILKPLGYYIKKKKREGN
ncbi:MAG: hypothetical protein GX896_09600, partial [Clostridiales bacterium]|nr:hypothetical protein [Clostridiales bacterium]